MRFLYVSYRDWADRIYHAIKDDRWARISTTQEVESISPHDFNLIFFVGWSEIIPDHILSANNCLCLHPSKLPDYRGGSPIQHQILAGEKTSAVTFFRMNERLDAGDILEQIEFSLEGDLHQVFDEIVDNSIKGIRKIVQNCLSSNLNFTPQVNPIYRPYQRRKPKHSEIKLTDFLYSSAKDIHDKIRGLQDPYPNAYILMNDGSKLYLTSSKYEPAPEVGPKKILVLGHLGMLGHMVCRYLSQYHTVVTIEGKFPEQNYKDEIISFNGDYIINCVGSIPQKTQNFDINTELPKWLERASRCRVIHPATDCEIDDDAYGLSKRRATEYILSYGKKTKIIRCSIIGPELNNHKSLFDWFLMNQSEKIQGYTDAIWNGITTLQWAKVCHDMIDNWDSFKRLNTVEGECISKFHLLYMMAEEFKKEVIILPARGRGKDKTLQGEIKSPPIRKQIKDIIEFYYS